MKLFRILPILLVTACATLSPQQSALLAQAKPIAETVGRAYFLV